MNLYPEFEGKIVVITGVSSGIGFEQAKAFLDAGAKVFGADIQNGGQVYELNDHGNFNFTKCDVSDSQEIEAWLNPIIENNQIDILINTAGILDGYAPTLETTEDQWDKIFNTNLKSIFRITNLILPQMLENGQERSLTWHRSLAWLPVAAGQHIRLQNLELSVIQSNWIMITQLKEFGQIALLPGQLKPQ